MSNDTQQRDRLLVADSATRKTYPMFSGLLAYFPDALAYVAWVSHHGNEKHNPGEPLHHARGKSMDHADCIVRHVARHGEFDGDVRESGALAWRALALLQEELEKANGFPLPRGARGTEPNEMQEHWGPKTEGGAPVIPAAGGVIQVKPKPGESTSEAICRTALGAHRFDRAVQQRMAHNADPETRHGGLPIAKPESKHGFTVGEVVKIHGGELGTVLGFDGEFVRVNSGNYPYGGWYPGNLRSVL